MSGENTEERRNVRESVCAGTWYPGSARELERVIDGLFAQAGALNLSATIRAMVVPHAGYPYSGQIAANAYAQLQDSYGTVFLLGPAHRYPLSDVSILDVSHYRTPLGDVPLSEKAARMIERESLVHTMARAHEDEHSLEIQLPFLQRCLQDLTIVPALVGRSNPEDLQKVLDTYLDEDDLLVVSADLSHFHDYKQARYLDSFTIESMLSRNHRDILNAEIDAPWAVSTLLLLAKEKNWQPQLVTYANSGDVTGDRTRVVGYASLLFLDAEMKGLEEDSD